MGERATIPPHRSLGVIRASPAFEIRSIAPCLQAVDPRPYGSGGGFGGRNVK
jgi:hypothetical protein